MTSGAATMASARRRTLPSGAVGDAPGHDDLVQRLASNRAISRALAGEPAEASGVTVGHADDPAERAADRMATRAVARLDQDAAPVDAALDHSPAGAVGGAAIRRRTDAVVGKEGGDPGPEVASTLAASRSGGAPLQDDVRTTFESAMGADLSGVRVHTDRTADTLSRQLSAEAFTTGNDVYFRRGGFQPGTPQGQQTLAHELAHVVQGGGAVQRAYLDGGDNFAKATTKKTLGIKHSRSPELVAIETALTAYTGSGGGATDAQMLDLLRKLQEKIAAWRRLGKEQHAANAVAELTKEIDGQFATTKVKNALYDERLVRHRADRATILEWIDEGAKQEADIRLRNSCQWIQEGRTKFYIVHETHDQRERYGALTNTAADAVPVNARAYFPNPLTGKGSVFDAAEDYDRDNPASSRNVMLRERGRGLKGFNVSGALIAVTEEGMADGKAEVLGTIKHETQHDADMNKGDELNAGVADAEARETAAEQKLAKLTGDESAAKKRRKKHPKKYASAVSKREQFEQSDEYTKRTDRVDVATALRRYKTEYRAHFYQGDNRFDAKSHTDNVTAANLQWTSRQLEIFNKILANYTYVSEWWGQPVGTAPQGPRAAMQLEYRNAVNAYVNPDTEGFNKFNSVRIDDLYKSLHVCAAPTASSSDPGVRAVLAVVDRLDAHDIAYLEDAAQSRMINQKIDRTLTGSAKKSFTRHLSERKDKLAGIKRPKKKKKALVNPAKDKAKDGADAPDTAAETTQAVTS